MEASREPLTIETTVQNASQTFRQQLHNARYNAGLTKPKPHFLSINADPLPVRDKTAVFPATHKFQRHSCRLRTPLDSKKKSSCRRKQFLSPTTSPFSPLPSVQSDFYPRTKSILSYYPLPEKEEKLRKTDLLLSSDRCQKVSVSRLFQTLGERPPGATQGAKYWRKRQRCVSFHGIIRSDFLKGSHFLNTHFLFLMTVSEVVHPFYLPGPFKILRHVPHNHIISSNPIEPSLRCLIVARTYKGP